MKSMLLAAGLGTRLKPFTDHHPKALATVNGKTLLEHNIRYLQSFGINEVVVNVHHFADQIIDCVGKNNGFGSSVIISNEQDEVLETGGGLKKARPLLEGDKPILVMNVDVITNIDLYRLLAAHKANKAFATLAIMKRESSRGLLFDEKLRLHGWMNKITGDEKMALVTAGKLDLFAFSGIQLLSQEFLDAIPQTGKFSLIDTYLSLAKDQAIMGYDHTGDVFLDVGKPESLEKAAVLLSSGKAL